jgi:type II restriction/modification system DNA methylase subunit YeeA
MNKSALKRFATQSRLDLMAMVNTKLGYLLSLDESSLPIEYRDHASNIQKIKERCSKNGKIDSEIKDDFVEEVAYTWFNRLIALRFMDANEITDFAVISTTEEQILPPIYTKAKEGTIDKDLRLDRDKFFSLIDGKISASNPDNEAYKMLFIAVCNYYSSIMPFMFEAISDYTELLLPDDMLSLNSIRAVVVDAMPAEDCKDVEIIGWLYQFYIAQKKDDVFAALKKNKKITPSNIPAATQLFTPDWIVKYMVENSLGKLWMLNNPSSALKAQMKYYIENPDETTEFIKISSPEEITLLDPCMGSGHILTYAFDLLTMIYEEAGYNTSDIPTLILENNLYGCDIDKRAATLARFALTMKARIYYRRFFRNPITLNAIELQDFGSEVFEGIKNFGSLMTPKDEKQFSEGMFAHNTPDYQLQKNLLTQQYHCVITNPPYKAKSDLNQVLQSFMENAYPDSKADLYAVFMERSLELTKDLGFVAMINQHAWMFLPTYKNLRPKLIENFHIDTLLHLGLGVFEDMNTKVVQNVAFTIQKVVSTRRGYYKRLFVRQGVNEKLKEKEQWFLDKPFNLFLLDQQEFKRIPEYPIAYWISEQLRKSFEDSLLGELIPVKKGLDTGNNDYFLRLWHEVNLQKIGIGLKSGFETIVHSKKWVPYNKGGDFNKWYGNKEYVINWENNGKELADSTANLRSKHLYFKDAITWNALTFTTSARLSDYGALFDSAGSSMFPTENLYFYLAFINTKIVKSLLTIINPTMNFGAGSMSKLPVIFPNNDKIRIIEEIALQNVDISRSDWDNREVSWDFTTNPLIKYAEFGTINTAFNKYCNESVRLINELQENEEKINAYFIDIYGLNDELEAKVDLNEISIYKQEVDIVEGELVFKADEIVKQFISYGVGVMFGRYSLDQEGLVLANMGQEIPTNNTFTIDDDNIIPVLEDDYFTDDIASRFIEFVKVAFGEEHHTDNIQFIEDALGTTIRKYFVKGFYDDHIKRYKKRPIYWMVSSPKKSFNVLIYMHRYQDDIFARVQNNYLREYITKLEAAMHTATTIANDESNSAADRRKATKDIETITKKIDELIKFDRDKLTPFAQNRTPIDLDDGVKVNYSKFEEILYPIPGLSE